jgi:anti-sigma regulatory factor (Ser/Thr protein kinase)
MEKNLTLTNDVQQVTLLEDYINTIAEEADIDMSLALSLNLALEEAVTNVILYAYPEGQTGTVDIKATVDDSRRLTFIISDSGIPFDPTQKEDADVTLSVEERPIGGLGIFLVKQIMDDVTYERTNDRNILSMAKQLP